MNDLVPAHKLNLKPGWLHICGGEVMADPDWHVYFCKRCNRDVPSIECEVKST